MGKVVRFIQISDSHLGNTCEYTHRELNPYEHLRACVQAILKMNLTVDFVLHSGDLCGDKEQHAERPAYQIAERELSKLRVPIFYTAGNHDEVSHLKAIMTFGDNQPLTEDPNIIAYRFERAGYVFLVLHSSIPHERQGIISSDQWLALETELHSGTSPLVLMIHHPVLPIDSPWMDQHMLLRDGAKLHELLAKHRERILAVFYGHIHQPLITYRDQITYVSGPSCFFQFSTGPNDIECVLDRELPPGFNLVTLQDKTVTINTRYFMPLILQN